VSRPHRFSLEGACAAADRGDEEIASWVGDFLASRGSGNAVLAAVLALEPHWWFGPVLVPLEALERLAGPEPAAVCSVEPDEWEDDVVAMEASLERGWEPPPLLAEWRDGRLLLQDGNHRYEALARAGAAEAWVLVYFPTLGARDDFGERSLQSLRHGAGRR
jgi:hypothetical protein